MDTERGATSAPCRAPGISRRTLTDALVVLLWIAYYLYGTYGAGLPLP
jgi:hypothetical protein